VRALVENPCKDMVAKDWTDPKVQMQEVILLVARREFRSATTTRSHRRPELCYLLNAMSVVSQGAAIKAAMESKLILLHELRSAL
jgi:hypothetical protein